MTDQASNMSMWNVLVEPGDFGTGSEAGWPNSVGSKAKLKNIFESLRGRQNIFRSTHNQSRWTNRGDTPVIAQTGRVAEEIRDNMRWT